MPAGSDQLLRDLTRRPGVGCSSLKLPSSLVTHCVIDTSISKVIGCHTQPKRDAGGDPQVQSNNNERVQTCCCLIHPDETPAVPAKRSRGRVKRILFGIPT